VSFEVFFSSVADYSFFLGYTTVLQANQMSAFEGNVLPSISKGQ
jgi:hypothetical protein